MPNQLNSLVLTNIKTNGPKKGDDSLINQYYEEPVAVQETSGNFKTSVVHRMSQILLQTEALKKLVLQDMPLGEKA